MRTYQTVLILKPDLDDDQASQAHEKVAAYISKKGGNIIRTEKWGKKRLAYTVKKNRFGIYLNLFYDCDSLKIRSIENDFRLDETIIKYLILLLGKKEMSRVHGDPDLNGKAEEGDDKKETAEAKVVDKKEEDEAKVVDKKEEDGAKVVDKKEEDGAKVADKKETAEAKVVDEKEEAETKVVEKETAADEPNEKAASDKLD